MQDKSCIINQNIVKVDLKNKKYMEPNGCGVKNFDV
jgi:hypothetical protein